MQRDKLTFLQKIALESLWYSARLFAVLPYWFKFYVVEKLLYYLLYYCIRYRMSVVKMNLRNSFPEKSDRELAVIRRKFYRMLAEICVDTINMTYLSDQKIHRLLEIKNVEEHRKAVAGRDWIAMTAHFGCWEYCSLWGAFEPSQVTVAVYHPLESLVMEHFYRRLRSNENSTTVVPMRESLLFYLRNREKGINGKRLVMGLIADQNPPWRPDSHWFRFLNQDTIFFDGGEKLALRCKLPVYFLGMKRIKSGCYQMSLEQIYDGEEQVAEYEITERYVRRLEAMIEEHPDLWMWSHRRWKHKRTNVNS